MAVSLVLIANFQMLEASGDTGMLSQQAEQRGSERNKRGTVSCYFISWISVDVIMYIIMSSFSDAATFKLSFLEACNSQTDLAQR